MVVQVITNGLPEDNQVLLDEVTMRYVQNPDCTEDRDGDFQELVLSTRDNGVAKFLHIKTSGWSFDDVDDIATIIEDFKNIIGYEDSSNS